MNQAKFEAARRINDLENRLNIINESIRKTEDMLISAKQIQAMTRAELSAQRTALAAIPD